MKVVLVTPAGTSDRTPVQVQTWDDVARLIQIHGAGAVGDPIDSHTGEPVELEGERPAEEKQQDGGVRDASLTQAQRDGGQTDPGAGAAEGGQ